MSDFHEATTSLPPISGAGRRILLLDLDGTLSRSDPGILASVRHVFDVLGYPMPDQAALLRFVGPPIIESLALNGVPEQDLDKGLAAYRKAYTQPFFPDPAEPGHLLPGMFLNSLYEGIPQALATLRQQGYLLAVATAKPEPQAGPVCDYLGLTEQVDRVFGASLDISRRHKADVIRYAFESLSFSPGNGDRAVMIGDRWTDIDGARENGLDTIGVRWGYAEPDELESHGAVSIAETTADLPAVVNAYWD